jgi:hypothetical protein
MNTARLFVCALFIAILAGGAGHAVHARQLTSAPAVMVAVAGINDAGGRFQGTFLVTRFDSQPVTGSIVAMGSIAGVLNGRNVVAPASIPIRLGPSVRTANAASSCDAVHVDLLTSAFRMLGSVVTLNSTGFDIAASQPATSSTVIGPSTAAPAVQASGTTVQGTSGMTVQGNGPADTSGVGTFPTTQVGTIAPTAPVGSAAFGEISPPPPPAAPVAPQQLGELLCSISRLTQTTSPPAQVVPVLNQVLSALQP